MVADALVRSLGISNHGIGLVIIEYLGSSTGRVEHIEAGTKSPLSRWQHIRLKFSWNNDFVFDENFIWICFWGPLDSKSALAYVVAWHQIGNKPLL